MRPANGSSSRTAGETLMGLVHKNNPYEGFAFENYPVDLQGWNDQSRAFGQLITETKPRLIVELGSWKGASALRMATVIREAGLSTKILCVDTWLGGLEFWTDQDDRQRYHALNVNHGYPSVYYQFLANVCHKGFQQTIVPFPQTTATAALWLRFYGIKPELVYIDASHEEEDVYQDLSDYWEILPENGILFGDDYSWDGVRLAVNRFANDVKRVVSFVDDKWVLRRA